jgi:parallel beta-helix repeat protein
MRNGSLLAIFATVALFALAAPVTAATPSCGDTIKQDTTLDADVVCTNPGAIGLVVDADNITLRMNGHAIRGAGGSGSVGIRTSSVLGAHVVGVKIMNGTIDGFDGGVFMNAANSSLLKLTINATTNGVVLGSSGFVVPEPVPSVCEPAFPANNCLYRSVITVNTNLTTASGISLGGDNNEAWGNTVRGSVGAGIIQGGNLTRTVFNTVESCIPSNPSDPPGSWGILVGGYVTKAVVSLNRVAPCANAIGILATATLGAGVRVRSNVVTGNGDGIVVRDSTAVVRNNTSNDNFGDGIKVVDQPMLGQSSFVLLNTANRNGGNGINAPGVRDGGGNSATGNMGENCLGVVC